jgi:phenylacetate-CoA ligase
MTDEKIMATIKPDGEHWQPEIETMPREQLQQLQVKKLKDTINVCLKSPFYKKRLGDLGITAGSINSLDDLRKIPFTTKQDLRDNYPFGLVGGNLDDAVRITLPVVPQEIHVWLSILSTTSVRGPI